MENNVNERIAAIIQTASEEDWNEYDFYEAIFSIYTLEDIWKNCSTDFYIGCVEYLSTHAVKRKEIYYMTARELAERCAMLKDDYDMVGLPLGEWIQIIHETEDQINNGDIDAIKEWLESEINDCEGVDHLQDHADEAKELLAALIEWV